MVEEGDNWENPVLYSFGSQAGVLLINHVSPLYNHCVWVGFQSISIWLRGFFFPSALISSIIKTRLMPGSPQHAFRLTRPISIAVSRTEIVNLLKLIYFCQKKQNTNSIAFWAHAPTQDCSQVQFWRWFLEAWSVNVFGFQVSKPVSMVFTVRHAFLWPPNKDFFHKLSTNKRVRIWSKVTLPSKVRTVLSWTLLHGLLSWRIYT